MIVLFGERVEGKWKRARDVSRSKVWAWLGAVPLNLKSELILTISNPTKALYLSADLASNDVLSSKGDWKSCRCAATRRSLGSHLHVIIPPSHFASFSDMLSAVTFEEMSECPA